MKRVRLMCNSKKHTLWGPVVKDLYVRVYCMEVNVAVIILSSFGRFFLLSGIILIFSVVFIPEVVLVRKISPLGHAYVWRFSFVFVHRTLHVIYDLLFRKLYTLLPGIFYYTGYFIIFITDILYCSKKRLTMELPETDQKVMVLIFKFSVSWTKKFCNP